jgi:hypothetical protein
MTATDGGPALQGVPAPAAATPAGAAPAGAARAPGGAGAESGSTTMRPPARLRTVLGLANVEASMLVRSALVLLGLLAGGVVIWFFIWSLQPLWWNTAWEIGSGQLILGATVLMAAQLAAGRARRDGMADLYASFPATAGTRTAGQLAGLAGAVPASLLLIGASAAAVQVIGAIGAPSIMVLAGGVLLVIASGAVGIAIGTRFAHPLAGVLGALVLFAVSAQAYRFSASTTWLVPWDFKQDVLGSLPGPLAGYPPAGAHAVELAAIAVLAGIVALALTVRRARLRALLATAGVLALAVICLAGAVQLRPLPAAQMSRMVAQSANPASVQRCTTSNQVRYCIDVSFESLLPSLEAPVNAVLAHVPVRPGHRLTVSQVGQLALDPTLTRGYSREQIGRWGAELRRSPASTSPAAAIFLPIGAWPSFGGRLADAHFNVALATAQWAVGIPLASNTGVACVPVDQAREAIAIWLAIVATHPPTSELQAGLSGGSPGIEVANTFVPTWTYPGASYGQVDEVVGLPPQDTEAGYLLARAMTSLPEQKAGHVLTDGWARWVNARTTDAQLAAALGIRMPSVGAPQLPAGAKHVAVTPSAGNTQNPVCTS